MERRRRPGERRAVAKLSMKGRIALLAVQVILLCACAAFIVWNAQSGFTGERVKNQDAYLLDIERMNGSDMHTLDLQRGDVLRVRFETEDGSLRMEIIAPDGTSIYSGNGRGATDFMLRAPESGSYTVAVEARQARGKLHVRLFEEAG